MSIFYLLSHIFRKVLIIQVMPGWAYGKADAWEAFVDRWTGGNSEFTASSSTNSINRGHGGTHRQGNRSDGRFKEHLV